MQRSAVQLPCSAVAVASCSVGCAGEKRKESRLQLWYLASRMRGIVVEGDMGKRESGMVGGGGKRLHAMRVLDGAAQYSVVCRARYASAWHSAVRRGAARCIICSCCELQDRRPAGGANGRKCPVPRCGVDKRRVFEDVAERGAVLAWRG